MTETQTLTPDARLAMYREAEVALREFFSVDNYCLENCITQKHSKFNSFGTPGRLGCCTHNYFQFLETEMDALSSETMKEFKRLQRENATFERKEENECECHSETGCTIKQYLSPICLGFICPPHRNYLETEYKVDYSPNTRSRLTRILYGSENETDFINWLAKLKEATERVRKGEENQDSKQEVIKL
ncbi:MAG: hypothetical protein WCI72_04080 [archaeon]